MISLFNLNSYTSKIIEEKIENFKKNKTIYILFNLKNYNNHRINITLKSFFLKYLNYNHDYIVFANLIYDKEKYNYLCLEYIYDDENNIRLKITHWIESLNVETDENNIIFEDRGMIKL